MDLVQLLVKKSDTSEWFGSYWFHPSSTEAYKKAVSIEGYNLPEYT